MFKKGLIFLFLLFSLLSKAQDDRYFVLWNKNEVKVKPWEKISLSVAERSLYFPKNNTLGSVYGQFEVECVPKNWLEYGAAMRVIHINAQNGNWINENRPMVFVSFIKKLNAFKLSFSNRIEYRTYKELDDYFRHKQTLKLNFPALADWGLKFYLSEESFYKMNGVGTHSARFQSGVTALDKDWFAMKFYYILEKTKSSEVWLTGDILGLNLRFSI